MSATMPMMLQGSPEAVLDRLLAAVRVEWTHHRHVIDWALRTAAVTGSTTAEVLDVGVLLAVHDAQLVATPTSNSDESARQRATLRTVAAIARDPQAWATWAQSCRVELEGLLGPGLTYPSHLPV